MNEWQVVVVVITLFGFLAAAISPIIKLNTSITKLNITIENLNTVVVESKEKIDDHERRITKMEYEKRDGK